MVEYLDALAALDCERLRVEVRGGGTG